MAYLDPRHRAALLPHAYPAREVVTDLLREFAEEHIPPVLASCRPGRSQPERARPASATEGKFGHAFPGPVAVGPQVQPRALGPKRRETGL